jgi:hypothetical protein
VVEGACSEFECQLYHTHTHTHMHTHTTNIDILKNTHVLISAPRL